MSKIPKFKSEEEEVKFWDEHELTEFLDEFKEVKEPLFVKPIAGAKPWPGHPWKKQSNKPLT